MVCSLTQANAGTRFSYLQQKHLIIFSQKNEYWSCTYAPISTDQKFNLCIFCNLKENAGPKTITLLNHFLSRNVTICYVNMRK